MLELRLSTSARADIRKALARSLKKFGPSAAMRYQDLITQAIRDLRSDPHRPGTRRYPALLANGAFGYFIHYSKTNVAGERVDKPRHFLLCRVADDILYVGRILHDATDLPRHIPKSFRRKHV